VGRAIDNPISGERIVIQVSGTETDGKLLVFDLFLPPGTSVPARHVHPEQEERFTIREGELRFSIGRTTLTARPGQTVKVPQQTAHWFCNSGQTTAHARVEVRPALRMEELLETTETLGRTRLTDLALLLLEFQREIAVPLVPRSLVRAVLAPVAWFARRRAVTPL
jgi:quercetin dioxygenase-like cupin family protein